MTHKEMITELEATGTFLVIRKDTHSRVQCWFCNQWQDRKYTVEVDFSGIPEPVCLKCHNALRAREDALETELYMHELNTEVPE